MIAANQAVLFQNTNVHVTDIRNLELSYYTRVFTNFSTLCALVSGFVLTSVTNTDLTQFTRNLGSRIAGDMFMIFSAVSIASSTYCLQQSVLCNVYALGLAIRGPLGSMGHAVDGMRAEMDAIVLTFVVMVVSFAVSQTAFFWVVETTIIAWLSTIIVVIGSIFWYYYCARIMNRFHWNDSRVVWDDLDCGDAWDGTYEPERSIAEGYLYKKDISMKKDELDPWTRRYFVLDGTCLFYYENQERCVQNRSSPMNFRPIMIYGYEVRSTLSPPYIIHLVPIESEDDRREW